MSDAATMVQPPPSSTPSASTSQSNEYQPQQQQQQKQQQTSQYLPQQHSHPPQQNSHIVYQQSPQQQQIKQQNEQISISYESTNNTQPDLLQNHSNANYQHNNSTAQNNGGLYDPNNNGSVSNRANNGNGNGDNSNVTFTTLTPFRNHNASTENNSSNDEYVPNGGSIPFGLPPNLLMPANNENAQNSGNPNATHPPAPPHSLIQGPNGLMQTLPLHIPQQPLYPPPQGMHHQTQFQVPFMQNPHQLPQQPHPHMISHINGQSGPLMELKKDGHIVGPGGMLITPSSSAGPIPGTMNQQPPPHHGHYPGDNVASTANTSSNHTTPSSSAEDATDPYLCVWCTFKTIYKGNMKRHLISCHGGITDDLLRRLSFDVDRLRKLCPNRPHVNELPIMPKAPRQSASQSGEGGDGENCGTKQPKATKSNTGSGGSGRKRSTNGANGNSGADNGSRGRPRKSAKGDKSAKDEEKALSPPDEVFKNGRTSVKQEHDEVLRQNGAASSSPSATSIPARLNSKASASSAAASPSLMALSSGIAATSLMSPPPNSMASAIFSGGPSLLQAAPPQPMAQLQNSFGDLNQSLPPPHLQFGNPFPHPQTPLFMVMNPGNGPPPPLHGAPPPLFNPASMSHPLMIPQSQAHHPQLQHLPPPHLQQLDAMAAAGIPQPIYISSSTYHPSFLHPQQQLLPPQQVQQLQPRIQQLNNGPQQTPPNFASLSTIKAPIKECSNDSGISLHSYNTGVDL